LTDKYGSHQPARLSERERSNSIGHQHQHAGNHFEIGVSECSPTMTNISSCPLGPSLPSPLHWTPPDLADPNQHNQVDSGRSPRLMFKCPKSCSLLRDVQASVAGNWLALAALFHAKSLCFVAFHDQPYRKLDEHIFKCFAPFLQHRFQGFL